MTSPNKPQGDRTRSLGAPRFARRKGRIAGSLIAISSAAIVSIYTVGRAHSSSAYDQITGSAPAAAVSTTGAAASTPGAAVAYRDGTYKGTGNSRHGGMEVTVVIQNGKITSANVTSCGTRYPCSDVNSLVRSAVSKQAVPTNHVSGATDSSKAYTQALANALKQAKA